MRCKLREVVTKSNTGLDAIRRAPIVNEDTGIKCLRITDISQNKEYSEWGNCRVSNSDFEKFRLTACDIIVARTGATIGVNKIIEEKLDSVYNNGLIRLKIDNKKADPYYVYYALNTNDYWGRIDAVSSGTVAQPNMKMNDLLDYEFELPDIIVQKKVVNILKSIDLKIKANKRINDNLSFVC